MKGVEMSVKDKVVLGKHSSHCSTEWVTGFAHTHQNPIWLLPRQPASPSTACNYSLGQSTSFPWSPDRAFGRPAVVTKCKFNVHKARVQPWPTYTCCPWQLVGGNSPFPAAVRPSQGQDRDFSSVFPRVSGSALMQLCKSYFHKSLPPQISYFLSQSDFPAAISGEKKAPKWKYQSNNTWGSAILGSAGTCATAVITGTSHAWHESPKRWWEAGAGTTLLPWRVGQTHCSLANHQVLRHRYTSTLALHSMAPNTENQ